MGHSTSLSSYFDDEPDPYKRVPLTAAPSSPSLDPGIPSSYNVYSSKPLYSVVTTRTDRVSKPPFWLSFFSSLNHILKPRSYKQAADSKEWILTIQTELDVLAKIIYGI